MGLLYGHRRANPRERSQQLLILLHIQIKSQSTHSTTYKLPDKLSNSQRVLWLHIQMSFHSAKLLVTEISVPHCNFNGIISIFSLKTVHNNWPQFSRNNNMFRGMQHVQMLQVYKKLTLKCVWIARPFLTFPSYRCSTDTNHTILRCLQDWAWVATLTFRVTWRHRSRDHSIGHGQFTIGALLILTLYLQ